MPLVSKSNHVYSSTVCGLHCDWYSEIHSGVQFQKAGVAFFSHFSGPKTQNKGKKKWSKVSKVKPLFKCRFV